MKKRNPIAVFLLPLVTFGIYGIYWQVVTKGEMNKQGATIPTAWLIIIPFVNIWWLWKWSEGVEKVSGGKMSGVIAFLLLFLLGIIGAAVVQDTFNKTAVAAPTTPAQTPAASAETPAVESTPPQSSAPAA